MVTEIIKGVYHYPQSIIETTGGKVMHAVKGLDTHLETFGECYFSTAATNSPKAWKKHTKMVCNLFVPQGDVLFAFFDDRPESKDYQRVVEFRLSTKNYGRLVIEPGIWFGFVSKAEGSDSLILNISNIKHDPAESIRLEPGAVEIPYTWSLS